MAPRRSVIDLIAEDMKVEQAAAPSDPIREFVEANTSAGDVVFDIGANLGFYTKILAERGCEVFSFEPDPRSATNLRETLTYANAKLVQAAVSDKAGAVDFYMDLRPNLNGVSSSVNRLVGVDDYQTVIVPTLTIDGFCSERNLKPRLMKIDVEGHEAAVFRGATDTIKECRPFIVFEFWQSWWREQPPWCAAPGAAIEQVFDFLHGEGYDLRIVQTGEPAYERYKASTTTPYMSAVDVACYPNFGP